MITYSTHAETAMAERGIPPDWIERTLARPDADESDPNHPERRRAFGRVPERGGRVLRVVYAATHDGARVITVFLDRGRRANP